MNRQFFSLLSSFPVFVRNRVLLEKKGGAPESATLRGPPSIRGLKAFLLLKGGEAPEVAQFRGPPLDAFIVLNAEPFGGAP
jgi:hypothetical protein